MIKVKHRFGKELLCTSVSLEYLEKNFVFRNEHKGRIFRRNIIKSFLKI